MNRLNPRFSSVLFCLALVASFSLGGSPFCFARSDSENIEQAMTPDEFRAAGLQKLSPAELEKLNAWLKGEREKVEKKVSAREEVLRKKMIVSRIDGVLTTAEPGTVIPLEDGTSWKIGNPSHYYSGYADHPPVAVFQTIFGWKMRVGRVAEFYVVPVKMH